jgi:ribosomal protein S16
MLKLRLKKYGRKGQASYRIVAIPSATKRDGRVTEELGFYNPHTNEANINVKLCAKVNPVINLIKFLNGIKLNIMAITNNK